MPQHDTDAQQLARLAQAGDPDAFEELSRLFEDRLAASVTGWSRFRLDPGVTVDEVVHETFVQAFQSIQSFEWRGEDAYLRWLCGIAKRTLARLYRTRRAIPSNELALDGDGGDPTPSVVRRRHERFDRLEAALEKLSPDHRTVLLFSRVQGLSAPEIGERMGRSANAIRHLIVRALRELRKRFGDDTESLSLPDRQFGCAGETDE